MQRETERVELAIRKLLETLDASDRDEVMVNLISEWCDDYEFDEDEGFLTTTKILRNEDGSISRKE